MLEKCGVRCLDTVDSVPIPECEVEEGGAGAGLMQQIGGRTGGLDGTEREEDSGWVLDCKRDEVPLFTGGIGAEREGSG